MPGSNSSSGSQDSSEGGIDVNVSVNGVPLPSVTGGPEGSTPGMPGSSPGAPAMPGSGTVGDGSNGSADPGGQAGGGIVYGGANDPFGDLGTPGATGSTGTMTAAERRAVLDARLEEGYAVFDGIILGERERAQAQADAAGSEVMGTGAGGGAGDGSEEGGGFFDNLPPGVIVASSSEGSAGGGPGAPIGGEGSSANQNTQTFPIPEDIPSGNADDVVARQLREAAMSEPDPELREKLWDEYRRYTGLPTVSE